MKNIEEVIEKLEAANIGVDEYKENDILCGYELNTYTNGGVNQNIFLDFRDTSLNPMDVKDFMKVYDERIESIDEDEEVELHRQDERYKQNFTIIESIHDFLDWKKELSEIFKGEDKRKSTQRQFEQVVNKFESLIAEMEETLKLMPIKGDNSRECQRLNINSALSGLESCINGIELKDFEPNDYSGDFELSYS